MKRTWVDEMKQLSSKISVPTILFWLSDREPKYTMNPSSYSGMLGTYPQLVDENMIEEVKPYFDNYIQLVSKKGQPVQFTNKFTGDTGKCFFGKSYRNSHGYYPSQEIHNEACDLLIPTIEKYMDSDKKLGHTTFYQGLVAPFKNERLNFEEREVREFLAKYMPAILKNTPEALIATDVENTWIDDLSKVSCISLVPFGKTSHFSILDKEDLTKSDSTVTGFTSNNILVLDVLNDPSMSINTAVESLPSYQILSVIGNHLLLTKASDIEAEKRKLTDAILFHKSPIFKLENIDIAGKPHYSVHMRRPSDYNIDHFQYIEDQKIIV